VQANLAVEKARGFPQSLQHAVLGIGCLRIHAGSVLAIARPSTAEERTTDLQNRTPTGRLHLADVMIGGETGKYAQIQLLWA
jgi:hypothetical protein